MIDVKDLVVGSYLKSKDGFLQEVTETGKVAIVCIERWGGPNSCSVDIDATHSLEDLEPISITVEWLDRLGFTRMENTLFRNYSNPKVSGHIAMNVRTSNMPVYWLSGVAISVEYIHHLQALVWNLERVWLTIAP